MKTSNKQKVTNILKMKSIHISRYQTILIVNTRKTVALYYLIQKSIQTQHKTMVQEYKSTCPKKGQNKVKLETIYNIRVTHTSSRRLLTQSTL